MLTPIRPHRLRSHAWSAVLFAAMVWSSEASAHGGIPHADMIVTQPNDPSHILLRSQVWGLYESHDGGQTWTWICAESFGISSTTASRYTALLLTDGTIVVAGGFKGLQRSDASSCGWSVDPFFDDPATCSPSETCVVNDVLLTADGSKLIALTSTGHGATDGGPAGVDSIIWQSDDSGQTWTALGSPIPESFSSQNILISPSDPARLYVVGKRVDDPNGIVYRSDDGGLTWASFTAFSVTDANAPSYTARLAGVRANGDGTDTVYFWVDYPQSSSNLKIPPDVLYASSDNGEMWSPLFTGTDDLPGVAVSPDGATLIVSGPGDGAWKADATAAASQGQSAFQLLLEPKTWDVEWTSSGLLIGTDDFASDQSTLSRSTTGDAPFEPTFVICDADIPAACDSSSTVGRICPVVRADSAMGTGYDTDILSSDRCVGSADAGSNPSGDAGADPKDDGGGACSCRVGPSHGRSSRSVEVIAACLAAVGLRRLERRSRRAARVAGRRETSR